MQYRYVWYYKTMSVKRKTTRIWILGLLLLPFVLFFIAKGSQFLTLGFQGLSRPSPTLSVGIGIPEEQRQMVITESVNDLAEKLQVDSEQITVLDIESREWPDTSLGCPEKGKFYLQVITAGYRIRLSIDGTVYTYHSGGNRVIPCSQ